MDSNNRLLLSEKEIILIKKLKPWLVSALACDSDRIRLIEGAKDPVPKDEQPFVWSRHPELTFGDIRALLKLINKV